MNTLFYVPKVYEPNIPGFQQDRSGLALYTHQLARGMRVHVTLHILTYKLTKGVKIHGISYLRHTKWDWIKSVTLEGLSQGVLRAIKTKSSLRKRLKQVFFSVDHMCAERAILLLKPDIVHFHGCSDGLLTYIDACEKHHIPFLVTLHGLIGIDPSITADQRYKDIERDLLIRGDERQWPISVISSGIKKRAVAHYGLQTSENIRVILNGTDFDLHSADQDSVDPWSLYNLDRNRRIIVCVGSLSKKKNQISVVRAWRLLPESVRKQHVVLFLGVDLQDGMVRNSIQEFGLEEDMRICDFVDKRTMAALYRHACLNVLASLVEGFGLSIIEAMCYGTPTLTYQDLDASADIEDARAVLLLSDRSDETLARGIESALARHWNRKEIVKCAQRYQMSTICDQYAAAYQDVMQASRK